MTARVEIPTRRDETIGYHARMVGVTDLSGYAGDTVSTRSPKRHASATSAYWAANPSVESKV